MTRKSDKKLDLRAFFLRISIKFTLFIVFFPSVLAISNAKTAFDNCDFNKSLNENDYTTTDLLIYNINNYKTDVFNNIKNIPQQELVKFKADKRYVTGTYWENDKPRVGFLFGFVFPDAAPPNELFRISSNFKKDDRYYNEVSGIFDGDISININLAMLAYRPRFFAFYDPLLYRTTSSHPAGYDAIVFQKLKDGTLVDITHDNFPDKLRETTYFHSKNSHEEIFVYCDDWAKQPMCSLFAGYNGSTFRILFHKRNFGISKEMHQMTIQFLNCAFDRSK